MNGWKIVQDGNRLLVVEGSLVMPPRLVGVKAAAMGLGGSPILYATAGDRVGKVDDAFNDDKDTWIQAELDKRATWVDRIRKFMELDGIAAHPVLTHLMSWAPSVVELRHKHYKASAIDTVAAYIESGILIPPAVKRELLEARDAELAELASSGRVMTVPRGTSSGRRSYSLDELGIDGVNI